jgi:hypothetical protein
MTNKEEQGKAIIEKLYLDRKIGFIKLAVSQYYGVDESIISSNHTNRTASKVRHVFQYLAIENGFVKKHVAKESKRDISNVDYGHATIKSHCSWDTELRSEVEHLMKLIENKSELLKQEIDISDKYYYIDLSNNISFKIGRDKSIVLSGFNNDELKEFIKFNNLSSIEPVKCTNTNLQIIIKK